MLAADVAQPLPALGRAALFRAPAISYRFLAALPDESFFDCGRLHATLSTSACADMWRQANEGRSERYSACRACFIGASHAGVDNATHSPIAGALVCARCTRGCTRLIHANLCVSCFNREREMIRGRNARGVPPTKLAPLAPRRIFFFANGYPHVVRSERTTSPAELLVATMRDAIHVVAFGWQAPRVGLRQLRLF